MKSGKLQRKRKNRTRFVRTYFVIGSVILMSIFIFYANYVFENIKSEVKIVPDLYSKFLSLPPDVNMEYFLFQYFMEDIIPEINYPIILVDSLKNPFSWENIDIPKKEFVQLSQDQQKLLLKMMQKMEASHSVIPLKFSKDDSKIHSYVFFGDSDAMKQVKKMPYFGMGLIMVFIFLGIYGVVIIKKNERDILWVGLAKETAHQFGTPLSSLSAWLNILENKLGNKKRDIQEIIDSMNFDLNRLNTVASRFGKVGSDIKHKNSKLHLIISEILMHFQNRLPQKIKLHFINEIPNFEVKIDTDLIKWTLENLIKNSLDAMQNKSGEIIIKAFKKNNRIHLQIIDEGSGMPKSMFKNIFKPGITTKKRGWGLGLSLAKRIVEEYHHGKIRVLESSDKGSILEIILPEE